MSGSGLSSVIRGSVCISKFQGILCVSFSLTDTVLCFCPFVHMVRFQLLAQFLIDPLPHPVVSSFEIFLRSIASFIYVINCFVSITTYPPFAIRLCLIYFRFNIVCSYGVICDSNKRDLASLVTMFMSSMRFR